MRTIETLLYYPTVAVPSEWAKTALFNGYSIGSITPQNWFSCISESVLDPSHNTKWPQGTPEAYLTRTEIEEISANRLFKKIDPNNRIYVNSKFKSAFFEIIESTIFKDRLEKQSPNFPDIPREELHRQSWVHEDKISYDIISRLVDNGLAYPDTKREMGMDFYIVDNNAADLYMSLLSQNIADKHSDIIPSSETLDHWKNLSNPGYSIKKQACINVVINNGVLSPAPGTSIESIIEFRDENLDECFKYQSKLFEIVKNVSCASDVEDIREIMNDEEKDIQIKLKGLAQNLEDLKIQCKYDIAFFSVVPLVDTALGITESITTGNFSRFEFIKGALGVLGSSVTCYYNYRKERKQKMRDSPLTYLYLANTRGISSISLDSRSQS